MKELLIATSNVHKVREVKEMLCSLTGVEMRSLRAFPDYKALSEDGETFEEIAIVKATHAAKELGCLVLADDSGLVVPALGDEPGIRSARYAGPDATDKDNRKKLLERMSGLKDLQRAAYFVCCVALAGPEGLIRCERGTVEGVILSEERGGGGFGYDPLFVKYDYSKSFAELDGATKNRVSHRRKAIDLILPYLEDALLT